MSRILRKNRSKKRIVRKKNMWKKKQNRLSPKLVLYCKKIRLHDSNKGVSFG